MKRVYSVFLWLIFVTSCSLTQLFADCGCNSCILDNKIPRENCRHKTFLYAMELMTARQAKVLVETGTARGGKGNCLGDGCSTLIFAEWAALHGASCYSVDISAENLQNAESNIERGRENVSFVHSDSVQFLANFNETIDFLYLDSYDFECHNPRPSQEHHLNEIIAAYPWLSEKSIVMIDDCNLPHGGKGKLVIEYLTHRGWRIVASDYQVVLVR